MSKLEHLIGVADRLVTGEGIVEFVRLQGGSTGFSGGAHFLQLAGVRGTSTQGIEQALASWLRLARKKLEPSGGAVR